MDTDNDDIASLANLKTLDGTPVLTGSSKRSLSSFVAEPCLSRLAFSHMCRLGSCAVYSVTVGWSDFPYYLYI